MKHGSLFSGIGGFDLAAEWMGWENVFHCENNPFCQKVLKHYWPDAVSYGDITQTDFTIWRGKVDILTGGFPCQPYSVAGKRKGTEDDRHLWPEMLRAIREIKPTWVVGENVSGLLSWSEGVVFEQVCAEMEAEGYEVQTVVLPACGVDAPHRRDRVWIIAHAGRDGIRKRSCESLRSAGLQPEQQNSDNMGPERWCISANTTKNPIGIRCDSSESESESSKRRQRKSCTGDDVRLQDATDSEAQRLQGSINANRSEREKYNDQQFAGRDRERTSPWKQWTTESAICGMDDGLSYKLDGITVSKHRVESIKGYGNAIVPQIAYKIFKAIEETNKSTL